MSYLDFLDTNDGKKITKLARQSTTFNSYYEYWREQLFERIMRLFVWENTYDVDTKIGIEAHHIEEMLLLAGHCGILNYNKELTSMYGSFHGVTKYHDEHTKYIVHCPIYSGTHTINKDIIIIKNNSLKNPSYELVHHYAIMLAHIECTLVMALVNARDSGGVPIAGTEKQKKSIELYQSKLYNGQYGVVSDDGFLGVTYGGTDKKSNQSIMDIIETREKILKSFYSDIGVRSAFEKRNNTVQAEVEADTSLLLLNLSDMLNCRMEGCSAVNKMFGTNWNVHIAKEIDYSTENERISFSSGTEVHVMEDDNDNSETNV